MCHAARSWKPCPYLPSTSNGAPALVVGGLRSQITKLAAEYHAIRTADAPLDDAKRQARELVAMLGKKGKPVIHTQFGELYVRGWAGAEQFGPTFHDATIATLCWLDPDRVIAKLDEALEALPQNGSALPISERASRLAERSRPRLRCSKTGKS